MAKETHVVKGARGPGLDFRTKPEPEMGARPAPASAGDPMVARLGDAAKEVFGRTEEPGAPAQKKNPGDQPSRGGTIQSGSTDSSNGQSGRPNPAAVELEPGAGEDGATPAGGGSGSPGGSGAKGSAADSAGGGGVGDGSEGKTTDPLALLAKGLPSEEKSAEAKTGEESESAASSASDKANGKASGGALRATLEKTLAEKKALESKLAEIEKREDPRVKDLTSAWEQEKKAREELEAKVAHLDYSESREFKERFVEPYNAAFKDTLAQLRTLPTEDGAKLSNDDLETIMVGGEMAAYQLIDEKFTGAKATMATGLVKDVYSLDRIRNRALEQAKGLAVERSKQNQAQAKARQESLRGLFQREIETRRKSGGELYNPVEGDKEHNQLLDEGAVLADAAFLRPANLTDEQAVQVMAEVRNRAAALPAVVRSYRKEKARADALEKELAKYRGHQPGNGEPGLAPGDEKQPEEGTMDFARAKLRELAGL